jgi:hypothetical protein
MMTENERIAVLETKMASVECNISNMDKKLDYITDFVQEEKIRIRNTWTVLGMTRSGIVLFAVVLGIAVTMSGILSSVINP